MTMRDPRDGGAALELNAAGISVTLLPDKGCDIFRIVEPRSGVDVLYKPPWGVRRVGSTPWTPDSPAHWIQSYSGGWQILLPNAGAEREAGGTIWGFHGEAALCPWDTTASAPAQASFATRLVSAPLLVQRDVAVAGSELRLFERVTNESPRPVHFAWGHHPAFGAPLLAPGARVATSARLFVADHSAPGREIEPSAQSAWPFARGRAGEVDLSTVPERHVRREAFGWLSDFDGPAAFVIANPKLALGVELCWPKEVFPYAWYWSELGASQDYPWFGRGYALAIEPGTVRTAGLSGGEGVTLDGGAHTSVEIVLRLLTDAALADALETIS